MNHKHALALVLAFSMSAAVAEDCFAPAKVPESKPVVKVYKKPKAKIASVGVHKVVHKKHKPKAKVAHVIPGPIKVACEVKKPSSVYTEPEAPSQSFPPGGGGFSTIPPIKPAPLPESVPTPSTPVPPYEQHFPPFGDFPIVEKPIVIMPPPIMTSVPEPSTVLLLAFGLFVMAYVSRRK